MHLPTTGSQGRAERGRGGVRVGRQQAAQTCRANLCVSRGASVLNVPTSKPHAASLVAATLRASAKPKPMAPGVKCEVMASPFRRLVSLCFIHRKHDEDHSPGTACVAARTLLGALRFLPLEACEIWGSTLVPGTLGYATRGPRIGLQPAPRSGLPLGYPLRALSRPSPPMGARLLLSILHRFVCPSKFIP